MASVSITQMDSVALDNGFTMFLPIVHVTASKKEREITIMAFWGKKEEPKQEQPTPQEGDIVGYENDTYRVRRVYGNQVQLVNNTTYTYPVVSTDQVEDTSYCGLCRAHIAISRGLHPHN